MNRKYYTALAVSTAAVGMVVLSSTEASAMPKDPPGTTSQRVPTVAPDWPDEGTGFPTSVPPKKGYRYAPTLPSYAMDHQTQGEPNYPNYDPKYEVPAATTAAKASSHDDTTTEVLQSGASALGGAAVALSCMWLYRRHQLRTT